MEECAYFVYKFVTNNDYLIAESQKHSKHPCNQQQCPQRQMQLASIQQNSTRQKKAIVYGILFLHSKAWVHVGRSICKVKQWHSTNSRWHWQKERGENTSIWVDQRGRKKKRQRLPSGCISITNLLSTCTPKNWQNRITTPTWPLCRSTVIIIPGPRRPFMITFDSSIGRTPT